MRKKIIFCCIIALCSSLLQATTIESFITAGELRSATTQIASESIEGYVPNEIADDTSLTQQEIAQILCNYLGIMPIYLPDKTIAQDPFIGRLFLEGIWTNTPEQLEGLITKAQWQNLWIKTQKCKINPLYSEELIKTHPLKKTIEVYQKTLKENKKKERKKVAIGEFEKGSYTLILEEKEYPTYQIHGKDFLSLTTLQAMGFEKVYAPKGLTFKYTKEKQREEDQKQIIGKDVFLANNTIWVEEVESYAVICNGQSYLPIQVLDTTFTLRDTNNNQYVLEPKMQKISDYVKVDQDRIKNNTQEPIQITYVQTYWDGKTLQTYEKVEKNLLPEQMVYNNKELYMLQGKVYQTLVVTKVETLTESEENLLVEQSMCGQNNEVILQTYEKACTEPKYSNPATKPSTKFPASIIIGTMRYDTNGFKKGQKLEVWAAEEGKYYFVKNKKGQNVRIPWNSIHIPKDPPTAKDVPTKQEIEKFINKQGISSKTKYLVWTDLYRQQTYILKGRKDEWYLTKRMTCSTGRNKTPTPRGMFELKARVPYFGVDKGYMCKNAFQISGDYLYHSIIFDVTGSYLLEGKGVLGQRASQGCIRFSPEESKWFYETMLTGTRVWIY